MANRWRQVVGTSGSRIYVVALQLTSTAITARYLGPEGRGIVVAAVTWVSTFSTLGYLSMAQPMFQRVSGRDPESWLGETLGTLLSIVGCVSLLGWGVAAGLYALSDGAFFKTLDAETLAIAFAALPFLLWQENGNSLLLAMGSLHVLNRVQVLAGTVSLLLVAILVVGFRLGIGAALAGVMVNSVLVSTLGLVYMLRRTPALRVDWSVARVLLTGGAKLHLGAVGSVLASQAALLIINQLRSPSETAFYHLAGQMLIALLIVPGAFSSVAYTVLTRQGPDRGWGEHRRLLGQSVLLALMMVAVAYLTAPLGVRLIAGESFQPAVPLFRILLVSVVGSTVAVVMVSQWVVRGLFSPLAAYGLVLGLVSVAGTYLLVPRYGLDGAAWTAAFISFLGLAVNGGVALWVERRWRSLVHDAA